jgi:hypothetical protein
MTAVPGPCRPLPALAGSRPTSLPPTSQSLPAARSGRSWGPLAVPESGQLRGVALFSPGGAIHGPSADFVNLAWRSKPADGPKGRAEDYDPPGEADPATGETRAAGKRYHWFRRMARLKQVCPPGTATAATGLPFCQLPGCLEG